MENFELPQGTENIEARDSSLEVQSLEDATHDSGGYVERSQTIREAETIENSFTSLIESAISPAGQTGEDSRVPFKPAHLTKSIDPGTGQSSSEEETSSPKSDSSPVYAGGEKDLAGVYTSNEGSTVGKTDDGPPDYQNEHAEPDVPARVAWDKDEEGGAGTLAGDLAGAGKQGSNDHKDPDPYNIDHELPEAKIKALGQGPHGLVQGGVAHGGPGGSHTSGGGDPVMGYGSGWTGEGGGKATWTGKHETKDGKKVEQHGESDSCTSTKNEAESNAQKNSKAGGRGEYNITCSDGTKYVIKYNPHGYGVTKIYYPIEGESPMPYTGSGTDHHTETPYGPKTGPDREASLLRMLAGGKTDQKIYVGMGSSGSTTFSPSGGGEEDDSGKFYGGLYDSAYRPNNPDNPDYYTPNILAEALKAKGTGS
jgi:hypothetical protein